MSDNAKRELSAEPSAVTAEEIEQRIVEVGEKIKQAPAKQEPRPQEYPRKHPENYTIATCAHMIQSTIPGSEKYGQKNLFKLLREAGVLREGGELHNTPRYDPYIKEGLFTTTYKTRVRNGVTIYDRLTVATPNGLAFIADLVEQHIAEQRAAEQAENASTKGAQPQHTNPEPTPATEQNFTAKQAI